MFTETHIIIPHICFQISQLQQEVELQARKLRNTEDEHRQAIEELRQREERLIKQVIIVNFCTGMGSCFLVVSLMLLLGGTFFKKWVKIASISGKYYVINCILEL